MTENILIYKWTGTGQQFIDINKGNSMVNRKLMRQHGLQNVLAANYFCISSSAPSPSGVAAVSISGAARSWCVRNALVKAFALWREQNKRGYDASSPSIKGTWRDFKVYLDVAHKDSVIAGTDLTPVSGGVLGMGTSGAYIAPEEWRYSQIVTVEGVEAGAASELDVDSLPLTIYGDNSHGTGGQWGIIQSYQQSRALVPLEDPLLPVGTTTNMYSQAQGDLSLADETLIGEAAVDGDAAPYDQNLYPGAIGNGEYPMTYCAAAYNRITDGGRTLSLGGFSAPNGVIRIDTKGTESDDEHYLVLYLGSKEAY